MQRIRRRRFLAGIAGLLTQTSPAAGGGQPAHAPATVAGNGNTRPRLPKGLLWSMLPLSMPIADRFKLAADLGFQGVEMEPAEDQERLEALRSGADKTGVRIHSIMNSGSWRTPLSSGDDAVARQGLGLLRNSLRQARFLGADTVLMIPAVVTPDIRYKDAWQRSQRWLREALPQARELKVAIAIENVGNRFLLSPLEFARYIDEMADPLLQAYFDVGNSLYLWGYPQDWILTLGRRIRKIHLKDCDLGKRRFVLLLNGDVDWPAVRQAIDKVRFSGFLTVEPNYRSPQLEAGDRGYLEEIARRMDLIIDGR